MTSGNHDFDVVPDLVANLSNYNISQLGKNGEWEAVQLSKQGAPAARLAGWSFPGQHVNYNPLEELDLEFTDDLPVIGVMHGDLGRSNSRYAPITGSDLERPGYDGWLIGHIHNPELRGSSDPVVLIPGTPQALDPTESGPHGPWLLTLDERRIAGIDQFPLASIRYERVTIDADKMEGVEEIPGRFFTKTDELIEGIPHRELQLLIVTLELVGRTSIYGELEGIENKLVEDLRRDSGNTGITVGSVINRTLPPLDLEDIAGGNNPPAMLAELLLKLEKEKESEYPEELIKKTQNALTEAYYANAYKVLRTHGETSPPDKETSLELLKSQGWRVLECLLSQTK